MIYKVFLERASLMAKSTGLFTMYYEVEPEANSAVSIPAELKPVVNIATSGAPA